jgi:hypothetical protein
MIALVATDLHLSDSSSCVTCHQAEHRSFLSPPATMTPPLHAMTGFPLDVPHNKVKCAECHREIGKPHPAAGGAILAEAFSARFPGRKPEDCAACHADRHGGQFLATASRGRCVSCHAPTHFTPANFDLAHHEKTRFPLTGSHKAVSCALCHKKEKDLVRFVPMAMTCNACHVDVHRGRFDEPGRPPSIEGRQGCARCHTTASFGQIAWKAPDHALWTGYALKREHAAASCVDCHTRSARPARVCRLPSTG